MNISNYLSYLKQEKKEKDPLLKRGKIKVPLCHYIISNACILNTLELNSIHMNNWIWLNIENWFSKCTHLNKEVCSRDDLLPVKASGEFWERFLLVVTQGKLANNFLPKLEVEIYYVDCLLYRQSEYNKQNIDFVWQIIKMIEIKLVLKNMSQQRCINL